MPTCTIILTLITCANLSPQSPTDAAAVLRAPATRIRAAVPWNEGVSYSIPYTPPRVTPLPPSRNWTSMTTWTPRYGPPVVVLTYPDRHTSITGGLYDSRSSFAYPLVHTNRRSHTSQTGRSRIR